MFHTSHACSFEASGSRRSPRFPFARVAVACLWTSMLGAQADPLAMPPLEVTVSADGTNYGTVIEGNPAGFAYVRCTTDSSAAGGWYRAVASAAIHDANYFDGGLEQLRATTVQLGEIAACFTGCDPDPYLGSQWEIHSSFVAAKDTLGLMLLTDGEPTEDAVRSFGALLSYALPQIVDEYHLSPNHGWLTDPGTQAFNLDAIRQSAVWANVAAAVQMEKDEFFASDLYAKMSAYDLEVSLTLIGVRGADVVPGPGMNPPAPGLTGYPAAPPKMTTSGRARITYAGTGGQTLHFIPPWSTGQVPIYGVMQGHTVNMQASGFAPSMQVALCSETESPSQRFELTLQWADFGKVAMTVPAAAVPGFFRVKYYRYQVPGPNGPTYLPWQVIPASKRPRVLVTSA